MLLLLVLPALKGGRLPGRQGRDVRGAGGVRRNAQAVEAGGASVDTWVGSCAVCGGGGGGPTRHGCKSAMCQTIVGEGLVELRGASWLGGVMSDAGRWAGGSDFAGAGRTPTQHTLCVYTYVTRSMHVRTC